LSANCTRRRIRQWWRAAIAAAAIVSPHAAAADQPVHDVQIVASRYAFEPATIHVTAGESVRLVIRSKDVVHGFSIPDLKIDVRIPAGEPITVEFAAPPPGRYDIACSEYCGVGHGQMRASLVSVASTGTATATSAMPGAADDPSGAQTPLPDTADEDVRISPAEPDFTLISLPTALRVPRFKSAFRVTHRFAQPLNGSVGDVAGNLFGLDSGAQIGLEYRFGIVRNGEIGIHRTSDRTIEFFSQYGLVRQTPGRPVDVSVLVSVEGTNNFRDQYSPVLGAIVSRTLGERAALYVEPTWVHHANVQPSTSVAGASTDTVMLGLGGRFRIRPTVSIVTEFSPRAPGFRPGVNHGGVAIEKRAGGHMFQLNVSDSFATTMGQIARGGPVGNDWHLGFNISRKFY
jgi:cytochrome c oxidase subunit 2